MRRREKILVAIAVVTLLLVYPFNLTVAPEWEVKVVDENGNPLAGAYVSESASHGMLDFAHQKAVCTNARGAAHFARRTVHASVLTWVSKLISRFNMYGLSPYVTVGVDRLGYGEMPTDGPNPNFNGLLWYGSPNRMNSRVVLHKCPAGLTGYQCLSDYQYFFEIGGASAQKIASCAGR